MPKLTLTHDEPYSGTDQGDNNKPIDLQPGDSTNVSDAKATQLLEDFPDWFKKAGRGKAAPKTYTDLDGQPLRDLATSRGLQLDASADDATIRAALVALDESKD